MNQRILAISPRQSRFGYALFEQPNRLLDWGASAIPARFNGRSALEAARKRIAAVLRRCHPAVVVSMRPRRTKVGRTATESPIYRALLQQSVALGIPILVVNRPEVIEVFRTQNAASREKIADVLASRFPELLMRLPPKRKKWQPERRVMVVFDAVAVGITYWHRNASKIGASNETSRFSAGPSPVGLGLFDQPAK